VKDNVQKQGARPGTYEVWYVTWNHPNGQGYWLRYIIKAPLRTDGRGDHEPPRGELWFARMDPEDPAQTFGIHEHYPIDQVKTDAEPFAVTIAGCLLTDRRAFGELAGAGHAIRWDLRWEPSPATLLMLPDAMYARGGIGDTSVLSPNPQIAISGTVTIDGVELSFDGVPGEQSHVWGKKHAYSWAWAHCADFDEAPGATFVMLGARLQRRGITLPPLTIMTLDLDGERHRLSNFRNVLGNRSTWDTGVIRFSSWSPTLRLEGSFTCSPEQMVSCPYVDPDGQELTCVNSEIGDVEIIVQRRRGLRWAEERQLISTGRGHFEIGSRARDPAVTRRHVLVK